jgi:general secretion pathway protein D
VEQQDLRALQLYRMHHVDAEEVARKLQELGVISKLPDATGSSRYPSTTSRITPQLPGQPRQPNVPAIPEPQIASTTEVTEKGLVEEPQVVVVEATNSLLVNATAEQHAKIAHIIEYVDSETLSNEIPYKIYPLENSSPKHLAEVLQNLIQDTVEQQKEGGKIEKVIVNKDEKIKIVPDPNTYSLIVYANKKNQEWISNLISQLDKRRPQVLIDVTLVEISKFDQFDYDLNLLRSSPDLASTSGVTGVSSTATTLGKAVQTPSTGGLSAFYGDKQIQALLDTVQAKTYGRLLAKPKLLVNDNEKGKIDSKNTTYVEVTSSMPVGSGVPGTTSGLVQSSTNFNSYDAGITLDITPHISEGDLLRLDIRIARSDFGDILGTRPPDKKSSEVETAVTLPNGSTVILGGMVKMKQTKGGKKVPILGDIPLLGGLFRSIHNLEDGTRLYIFVKAEIIRPDETSSHGMKGLEVLSDRNRQAFEKHELEFQGYQDWPGIKSKQADPSRVLDAQ